MDNVQKHNIGKQTQGESSCKYILFPSYLQLFSFHSHVSAISLLAFKAVFDILKKNLLVTYVSNIFLVSCFVTQVPEF
jgi:hypothetical protein